MYTRKKFNLSTISKACLLVLGAGSLPAMAADSPASTKKVDEVEVITVSGIRGSLKRSMNDKRFSTEIMDSISAEDIGQLPDENIAEALQRVTGIQMSRTSDGEGSTIQIRGISDNNVEINGQSAAGSEADRSVNFQDLPSELFSGIEVFKAPTADRVEGSLGGTINLKTRKPLNINKDQLLTITAKGKYSEVPDDIAPDLNVFFSKNFRDTAYGDFGLIFNGGSKKVVTRTDAYGGGDFESATALWLKKTGVDVPAGSTKVNPFKKAGPFAYDSNVDVNGDGVADANDVFYMPAGFRSFTRALESKRDSFNSSFQWQPNEDLNLFLDLTYNESKQVEGGSHVNVQINGGRSYILADGDQTFNNLGNGTYVLEKGLIGSANLRYGGAPSTKIIWRDSQKFTFGGDYQLNDRLNVAFVLNSSKGDKRTSQSSLNMAYDFNGDNNINANDNTAIISFNHADSLLPYLTYYNSPFGANGPSSIGELDAIDYTSLSNPNLNFNQLQRNADDSQNNDESAQLDFTYELDGDVITTVQTGVRYSTKEFHRASWQNQSQNKASFTDGLTQTVNIRQIAVDPSSNASAENAQIAQDFQQCFTDVEIDLDHGGNMPQSWANTECDSDFFTDYFGMHDIRAISESRGAGYYERPESRYTVEEETLAMYVRADFMTEVSGLEFFGNFGVRYISTDTTSTGLVAANPEAKPGSQTFNTESFGGDYQEFLPSINLNLALTNDMFLRFAAYKAISRPGLSKLSPGVRLRVNDELEGIAGIADLGNPNLKPIKATNLDLSYEWYYSDSSMFAAAIFYKDLDSIIATSPLRVEIDLGGQTWLASQPANLPGTKIKGYELNIQHSFDHLAGLLTHTGIGANYTYTSENSDLFDQEGDQITRKGLSENSFNFSTYYDDGKLSLRLAYTWRDDFVRRENVVLGFGSKYLLPEMEKARGQLDLSANYTVTKSLKVNFSAVNLTDSTTERFMKYENLTNFVANSGRRYNLGVVYRF